ncbi:MAG: class I SAM-dependent methyltransferase [Anaerolineae bacterium]
MGEMSLRKRWFAWAYHTFVSRTGTPDFADTLTRQVRAPLLARARGEVLEIGAGDGANLPFYPAGTQVTLLEPNPYLLAYLRDAQSGAHCTIVGWIRGWGEQLPVGSGQFDTVVATHVLCSVRDQARVLDEVRRVLRPGGQFLFLEHVAAPTRSLTLAMQYVLNPAWSALGDGCHLTRDTGAIIQAAGFRQVEMRTFRAPYPAFVSPHIVGVAMV